MLVAAHGNSLRAIIKHLDGIDDETIAGLNVPTGIPLVYELDENLTPVTKGGTYLDPEAAAAGAAEGSEGGATDVSVSSTSMMRSAETEARGIIVATIVAIITLMRIWMR